VYVKHGLRIGRSKANDILLLDDDTVELNHAQIHVINGTPSLNTTRPDVHVRVDERLVQKLELHPGVCFGIGKTNFECHAGQSLPAGLLEFDFTICSHCGEPFAETMPQPGVNSAFVTCSKCGQSCLMIQTASLPRSAYVPTNYGQFTAVCFVTHGGMSIVLKGQRDAGYESVAIKLLWPPSQQDSLATQRFHREAEALRNIAHPNVVGLIESGRTGPFSYLVTEWVEGCSLRETILENEGNKKFCEFDQACIWMREACKALQVVHELGIVHRDIKPSNLLITGGGSLKLADLGLAKATVQTQTELTQTGQAPGTLLYMSPEQHRTPDFVDARSDLYSLGITFYELLTHRFPMGRWQPPSKINPAVPVEFDSLIEKLLEPEPEERISSAVDVIGYLDSFFVRISKRQKTEQITTPVESSERKFTVKASSTLLAVAVVAATFFVWAVLWKPDPPPEKEITNSIGMKLTLIPVGEFLMGSPEDEADSAVDEGPQHKVRITKPFYMGATEVTQGQWVSVMDTKPWSGKKYYEEGNDNPAVYVSWDDVVAYCKKLSSTENKLYRLPTEAEWEYACRGGTTTAYSFGSSTESLKDYAWFGENAKHIDDKYAYLVGTKNPNPFGLHDMHGNVWEFCSDWYGSDYYGSSPASDPPGATTGSDRVYRGGCGCDAAGRCRSAGRGRGDPSLRDFFLGFRLALIPSGQ